MSRGIIGGILDSCDDGTAVVFTDGSCLGNPGPCGAGACVFPPGVSEPILLKQPVSSRGSILLGEVVAIKMALQYLYRYKTQKPSGLRKVHIFSDSQSAVGQLTLGWEAKSHRTTTQEVKSEINRLQDLRVEVELSWSPGYYDLISKFQVGLKSLLRQGLSEPDFYGDLVYKLKKIVGSNNFSAQFIKIISHYKKIGYNINVLQQTACLVVNPITVGNFAFLFNCTLVGRTSDSMMVPT